MERRILSGRGRMRAARRVDRRLLSACVLALAIASVAFAATRVLYDGALGTPPAAQGWSFGRVPFPGSASETVAGGATILDTLTATTDYAGYTSTVATPFALDRSRGYTIRFDVQVEAEDHAGSDRNADGVDDRAGFSVIALSADTLGIELGFWANEVWAQEGGPNEPPRFTHAESAALDTTAGVMRYDLSVLGDSYALYVNGAAAPILTGSLRDYSAEGPPYTGANFLFLGDDTASARARVRLARVVGFDAPLYPVRAYLPLVQR